MEKLMGALKELSSAEDFLEFFAVAYQPAVVQVNRLHILQRFHQYLRQAQLSAAGDEAEAFKTCGGLMEKAYQDFVCSSAGKEKVFKVFRDAAGIKTVSVEKLRATLSARNKAG